MGRASRAPSSRPNNRSRYYHDEQRYGRDSRQTVEEAEELVSASGEPEPPWSIQHPPHRGESWFARLTRIYGWRAYALPVLVVLTVLVIVNSVRQGEGSANAANTGNGSAANAALLNPITADSSPTERPVGVADSGATATLPDGAAITPHGNRTWHVVPGSGSRVGDGPKLYTYTVSVEDGIDPAEYGGDDAFAAMVQSTLSDPRSWIGKHEISLQRVDAGFPSPNFQIALTTPDTDHVLCGSQIRYESSCYNSTEGKVVINLARWVRGAKVFNGDVDTYRQYAINHEVGHALGAGHLGCVTDGGLAPVMMQQSFGVSDDYLFMINQMDPHNSDAVPQDGKNCRPNAWPTLQG